MPVTSDVISFPTRAVPAIVGLPAAGSFTCVTWMVIVLADALSLKPSFTRKAKLA